jgi:hypothetical protein
MGQDFDIGGTLQAGRYALCFSCWQSYWGSLCEQLERDIETLTWELETEGLTVPSGTKDEGRTLFIAEGQDIERKTAEIRKGQENE